jgi:cytochrome c-type biogenesis protein CcsB
MLMTVVYASLWLSALCYFLRRRTGEQRLDWGGIAFEGVSLLFLVIDLGQRAWRAGHWPLTNRYEVAMCVLGVIMLIHFLLIATWHEPRAGLPITVVALLVASYAITRPLSDKGITPLLPVLRTVWLQLHVFSTVIGYGAFGVAAGLGLMRTLPRWFAPQAPALDGGEEGESSGEMDETKVIERAMERVVALGFPWLSLGILTGAIWAQKAWGRYWDWDPKETWTLVTWLWYLLVMHVRSLRNWRGRRLAGLVVAGFAFVIFTYIGVPWLVRTVRLESLHGF